MKVGWPSIYPKPVMSEKSRSKGGRRYVPSGGGCAENRITLDPILNLDSIDRWNSPRSVI